MALPKEILNWPVNAPEETQTFHDGMFIGGYNPEGTVPGKKQRKFTLLQIRNFLFGVARTCSGLWTFTTGILTGYVSLSSSRIAFKELSFTSQAVSGWYKFAQTDAVAYNHALSDFYGGFSGNNRQINWGIVASFVGGATTRPLSVSYVDAYASATTAGLLPPVRMGYSNVIDAGAILEVYLDVVVSINGRIQIAKNIATGTNTGWSLLGNLVPSNGLLPDGITSATYLNARRVYPVESTISATGVFDVGVDDHIIKINTSSSDVTITLSNGSKEGQKITLFCSGANKAFIKGSGTLTAGKKSGIWDALDGSGTHMSNGLSMEMEWSTLLGIWIVREDVTADYQDVDQRVIMTSLGDLQIIVEMTGDTDTLISNVFGSTAGNVYYKQFSGTFSVPFNATPNYLQGLLLSGIDIRLSNVTNALYGATIYSTTTGQTVNGNICFLGKY